MPLVDFIMDREMWKYIFYERQYYQMHLTPSVVVGSVASEERRRGRHLNGTVSFTANESSPKANQCSHLANKPTAHKRPRLHFVRRNPISIPDENASG